MSDNLVIDDVQRKIKREEMLIRGAIAMRNSTNNPSVQNMADSQIREGRRNIEYFEKTLRDLQMRKMSQGVGALSVGGSGGSGGSSGDQGNGRPRSHARGSSVTLDQRSDSHVSSATYIPGTEDAGYGDIGPGGYSSQLDAGSGTMPARAPFSAPPPGSPTKARPNYSRLDLIKYDTPHLGPRIQIMLSQLEFKLSVEKQYKDGIEKIMGSYNLDGDRKIKAEAQGRRIESMQKIELLKRALKRYEDLHVDVETTADPTDDDSINGPSMRKPLTGLLSIRIHAVGDVNHAASGRLTRGPETFIIMKVEDEFKGRTKATRTDKWTDEIHEIDIDKGNEVELTVYDKAGTDHPLPIGMLWIRMSDIAEEMRRKKIETEFNNSGWVSADKTVEDGRPSRSEMQFNAPPGGLGPGSQGASFGGANSQGQSAQVWIDSWFSLEPVGRIQLSLSFAKETRERRPFDAGLNRKGAIRQRKEDVHELYGHKFIAQQFYNIMRCALCGELLKYAVGMQCSDCKYMCHEKCYPQVVTKCISKSNAESDPDEAKLNHRIPHRFEAYGNMGANWCCHCGYILPLGRKNVRRCKECKLVCHSHCTHLVPDFCGMSMKDANRILGEIKKAQARLPGQTVRTLRGPGREPKARPQPAAAPSYLTTDFDSGSPLSSLKDRYSYGNEQASDTSATQTPAMAQSRNTGTSAAAAVHMFNQSQQPTPRNPYERKPVGPVRTESSLAAAAAANALAGKRVPQQEQRPPTSNARSSLGYDRPSQPQPLQVAQYNPQAYAEVDQPFQPPIIQIPQPPQARPVVALPAQEPTVPSLPSPPPSGSTSSVMQFVERRDPPMSTRQQGSGRRIGLDHFNFLAVLGKGNFGKVMLAETKSTKQLYAIKVLKKEFIIENDEVESTKSERDVFIIANKARHPFLLNLHACFQTETRVYFVMEYISGGDLMLHIQRGTFGPKRALFYAAEVCLALKYFHENGVVYRDLKLDNILLTLDGHVKIGDYGLCKKDMYYGSTTSTFCGTPEFMAPEILLDKKYGRAVDWWAFGVLIYQMLLQQSPFRGEDEDEIYDAILADEPLYPIHMPRDSVSLLQQLLTRDPAERLGSGPTDAQEVMSHAFFRNINWQDIADKKVPVPFLPQIKSPTDTSNFDSEFTSVTPVLTPVQSVLSQAMQEEFRGFSYSADFV